MNFEISIASHRAVRDLPQKGSLAERLLGDLRLEWAAVTTAAAAGCLHAPTGCVRTATRRALSAVFCDLAATLGGHRRAGASGSSLGTARGRRRRSAAGRGRARSRRRGSRVNVLVNHEALAGQGRDQPCHYEPGGPPESLQAERRMSSRCLHGLSISTNTPSVSSVEPWTWPVRPTAAIFPFGATAPAQKKSPMLPKS